MKDRKLAFLVLSINIHFFYLKRQFAPDVLGGKYHKAHQYDFVAFVSSPPESNADWTRHFLEKFRLNESLEKEKGKHCLKKLEGYNSFKYLKILITYSSIIFSFLEHFWRSILCYSTWNINRLLSIYTFVVAEQSLTLGPYVHNCRVRFNHDAVIFYIS